LCTIFCTIVNIIGNHKNSKKSPDLNHELSLEQQFNTDLARVTCNFLALIKHENNPNKTIYFKTRPSYLYQISFLHNQIDQEQAIMRFLNSSYRDVFITELCEELDRFLIVTQEELEEDLEQTLTE
jgi:hypothetical protein